MSYEKWPIDDNHATAVANWEEYRIVTWFLNFVYRLHNKLLAIANRHAPYDKRYEKAPPW